MFCYEKTTVFDFGPMSAMKRVEWGPAWIVKPSWFLLAEEDRIINPKTQRFMAGRMGARVRSESADHSPMLKAPGLVIDLILEAARETLPA